MEETWLQTWVATRDAAAYDATLAAWVAANRSGEYLLARRPARVAVPTLPMPIEGHRAPRGTRIGIADLVAWLAGRDTRACPTPFAVKRWNAAGAGAAPDSESERHGLEVVDCLMAMRGGDDDGGGGGGGGGGDGGWRAEWTRPRDVQQALAHCLERAGASARPKRGYFYQAGGGAPIHLCPAGSV